MGILDNIQNWAAKEDNREGTSKNAQKDEETRLRQKLEELRAAVEQAKKESEVIFARHKKWGLISQEEINEQIDQPVVFLMRDDLSVDVIEGVVPGPLEIKNKKNAVTGLIILNPKKLHIVKWGGGHVRAWFAYEREATCYPTDILYDTQSILGEFMNVLMHMKTYAANKMPSGKHDWIWMAGGIIIMILIILGVMAMAGVSFSTLFEPKTTGVVVQNITGVTP